MYSPLTLCPYPRQMYKLKYINVHIPYPSPYVRCITIIHTSTFKQSLVSFIILSLVFLFYQILHRNCLLLHSQKSKICVHKSRFTLLQNTSTTPFSIFMYLSKLTQKFCTSAFTEIQNLCA